MTTARTARGGLVAAACLAAACFSDPGPPPLDSGTTSTGEPASSSSTSAAPTSTGPEPTTSTGESTGGASTTDDGPVCGDSVIEAPAEVCDDGNTIDTDSCRADCQLAECGDGVVWEGQEECDAGADNHPTLPDACRLNCAWPRCGDGAIYVGPLGPPSDVGGGPGLTIHGNDGPRAIGAAADGTFRALWRSDADVDAIYVQALAADGLPTGTPVDVLTLQFFSTRDPVLAVAGDGDVLVAWEATSNGGDIRVRAIIGGALQDSFVAHQSTGGVQDAAGLALAGSGAGAVAFLSSKEASTNQVVLRFFPDIGAPQTAPPEQAISTHVAGLATTPTVSMSPSGAFVVAWGEPSGAIVYRRFSADGAPGALVSAALRVGGGADPTNTKPWTGAALRPDGSVAIVGLDMGQLTLRLFDTNDSPGAAVAVADAPAAFYPFVDVASDATNNLTVAWVGCGQAGDAAEDCGALPSTSAVRWFYADLTPFGPAASAREAPAGEPEPLGLAVAPDGSTAVTYVGGADVFVRVARAQCP